MQSANPHGKNLKQNLDSLVAMMLYLVNIYWMNSRLANKEDVPIAPEI